MAWRGWGTHCQCHREGPRLTTRLFFFLCLRHQPSCRDQRQQFGVLSPKPFRAPDNGVESNFASLRIGK